MTKAISWQPAWSKCGSTPRPARACQPFARHWGYLRGGAAVLSSMPRIHVFALLVCLLPLLAAPPARANDTMIVAFTNNTRLEIFTIAMKMGGGGMSSSMHVVPGNTMTMSTSIGGPLQLNAVTLDMGVARFEFKDLSALAGKTDMNLSLEIDSAGAPWLESADSPPVRVPGKAVALIQQGEQGLPLERILGAKTMADVRALPGVSVHADSDDRLCAPVTFAGSLWAATVECGERERFSSDPAKIGLGPVILRGPLKEGAMGTLLQTLNDMGFRPWFMQFRAGPDMKTERVVKFPAEHAGREEAQAAMAALFAGRLTDSPASIDGLLVPDALYDAAMRDTLPSPAPVFRIHCSNADTLEVIFHPSGGMLVNMSR